MPTSVWDQEVQGAIDIAQSTQIKKVKVDNQFIEVPHPFPSPPDWRDQPIYFLMVDRFNNPNRPPQQPPYDAKTGVFQGGTFDGIRHRLGYLKELGVGAIWITPALKNCPYLDTFYGYGIQDFLQIDPRFASDPANAEGELQALIDEAHARGIYVVFDIVLNHTGDVFEYVLNNGQHVAEAPFRNERYAVNWRKKDGRGNPAWTQAPTDNDPDLHPDAVIWPRELRTNQHFRQQGAGGEEAGDFASLKELITASQEVRNTLIRIHQYLIAKFDIDAFRIDTLKFIEEDFARIFGNAMREFALSIGKKNFFTFGEVYDDEAKIARFIGRRALERGDLTGVDAALDFPLFYKLPGMAKGQVSPAEVIRVFELRKEVQRGIISSHGEVSRYFVTFLDNHDQKNRFYYRDPGDPHKYDDQLTLGLTCLHTLQGIPCLYYGTEQGLSGSGGDTDQAVREALWGKPNAFDPGHPFFQQIKRLNKVRNEQPALRYGRQYFRPVSGDGSSFGISFFTQGALAYSRILNDQEIVVAANTNTGSDLSFFVIIDSALNPTGAFYKVLFSNKTSPATPDAVEERIHGVTINEVDGAISHGPVRTIKVKLKPMEAQILVR